MSDEKDQMDKKAESSGSLKSTTDQDIEYEKSKEYILKQEHINVSRLKLARYWLAIVTTYYIFRCIFHQRLHMNDDIVCTSNFYV